MAAAALEQVAAAERRRPNRLQHASPMHPSQACRARRLARPGQARHGHCHGCSVLAGRHGRRRVPAVPPFTESNERHRRLSQALPHVACFITGLLRRCGTAAMASPPPRPLKEAGNLFIFWKEKNGNPNTLQQLRN